MKWAVGAIVAALVISAAGLVLLVTLLSATAGGLDGAAKQTAAGQQDATPSPAAIADIPTDRLAAYRTAAARYGIDWAILAGIAKEECDHGRNTQPGCAPPGTANFAGAQGPFQFIATTWSSTYRSPFQIIDRHGPAVPDGAEAAGGYATDCNHDGYADPWDPLDAACAAARYLKPNGAPADYQAAIWAYNHDQRYVTAVLTDAARYRSTSATSKSGPAATGDCTIADWPSILAAAPSDHARQALTAACSQLGVTYIWGGETPGQGFDCSGLTQWAYAQAGVPIGRVVRDQWSDGIPIADLSHGLPGDLIVLDGGDHIGIYLGGGNMIHAPHTGDVIRTSNVWQTPNAIRRVA